MDNFEVVWQTVNDKYFGPTFGGLESHTATIALKRPGGHAVVRVEDELDVTIGGPGRVEYYGQPRVTKKVSPLGVVTRLIDVKEVAAH